MIFIVVIGGLGRIEGPIIGAIVFFVLQEALADYGSAYLIALGIVAIVIVLLAPRGLWGLVVARRPMSAVRRSSDGSSRSSRRTDHEPVRRRDR